MVSTRHSLPSTTPTDTNPNPTSDTTPPAELSNKAKRLLRKLRIDANAALVSGEAPVKPPVDEGRTYHYRGAVYAVTGDEPQEWLEMEPERYQKRRSMAAERVKEGMESGDVVMGGIDEEVAGEQPQKKKRRSEATGRETAASEARRSPAAGKKRKRRLQEDGDDGNVDDDAHDDEQPRTTARKHPPTNRRRQPSSIRAPESTPQPGTTSTISPFDYTVNGGHETLTCAQHAAAARLRALHNGLPDPAEQRQQQEILSERTMAEGRTYHMARLTQEMAKVNERIARNRRAAAGLGRLQRGAGLTVAEGGGKPEAAQEGDSAEKARGKARQGPVVSGAPRTATKGARRDSMVDLSPSSGPKSPAADLGAGGRRGPEGVTLGRAEQYLFGGRFQGESLAGLKRRQALEEGMLERMMAGGGELFEGGGAVGEGAKAVGEAVAGAVAGETAAEGGVDAPATAEGTLSGAVPIQPTTVPRPQPGTVEPSTAESTAGEPTSHRPEAGELATGEVVQSCASSRQD
ncbi:hypothetical protein LTR53_000658 [Teratosphaeriaceae sp. CCFEE 6253]|nr:hypothetical protein LTR53_000658 [Teratosphaeriaceae sp. CCFEE 6253]